MRTLIAIAALLLPAANTFPQDNETESESDPTIEQLREEAAQAAIRMEYIGPRLPLESEDPDAPPPGTLPITSTFYGPAGEVSLSANSKLVMQLSELSDEECPPIAGDLVSLEYIDDNPMRPNITGRLSGGDWCKAGHPPGLYTGPCHVAIPRPPVGDRRPAIFIDRRTVTTWFRDESDNRMSVSPGGCRPVRLEPGRYRIYIEADVKRTSTFPCEEDASQECTRTAYTELVYEGGIRIDAGLEEREEITNVAQFVPRWSGRDPVPTAAEQARLVEQDPEGQRWTPEALGPDIDPNDYTFVDLLGPIFTHDRCVNCHSFFAPGGKVEIHIERVRFRDFDDSNYAPGQDMSSEVQAWIDERDQQDGEIPCHRCHRPFETQLQDFLWLPAKLVIEEDLNPQPWAGMSALELCNSEAVQYAFELGPAAGRQHLLNDPRIQWAVRVGWLPDGSEPDLPAVTWEEFVERVDLWLYAGQGRCEPE